MFFHILFPVKGKMVNFVPVMGNVPEEKPLFVFREESDDMRDICASLGVDVNTPGWPDMFGERLHGYMRDNGIRPVRTLSLFSGAGGLDIGFHDLVFDVVCSVEIEKQFCETLYVNSGEGRYFPHAKVCCTDIRDFDGGELDGIEWIIGGPPCQTFSAAGRRASGVLGTTDARGTLFREYVRLLKKLKPKGFLFENVYGIVGAQGGKPWNDIVSAFKDAGYMLYWRILDAADYGVPQHRERLIIVGLEDGAFKFPRPTNGPDSVGRVPFYDAKTAVSGLSLSPEEAKVGLNGRYGNLLYEVPPGLNYSFFTKEMGHPNPIFAWRSKFSDFLYKADPDTPVRTIKASGGQYTGPLHWDNRYFACSEYKRLQTFPDRYEISGSRMAVMKQIGNSVPPQLARMLAAAIRQQVFGTRFPFRLELLPDGAELSFRKRKRELTASYRKKAEHAIKRLYAGGGGKEFTGRSKDFYLTMTQRFECVRSADDGAYRVNVSWKDGMLRIKLRPRKAEGGHTSILIRPKHSWTLPVSGINLQVDGGGWMAVTAAWKVLDGELAANSLKADLTQLNGYYQYESKIECEMTSDNEQDYNIILPVVKGVCTQRGLSTKELAVLWNIEEGQVREKAVMLKHLGYEVRNVNTNPQMKADEWLIPYKFPTLTPQSVQLYKSV